MHRRRFFQFRLRTLLIVATLGCIGLAFVVVPARQQRQAVLELRQRRIDVSYEGERDTETWAQTWLGCDFGQRILYIWIRGNQYGIRGSNPPPTERDWQLIAMCHPQT